MVRAGFLIAWVRVGIFGATGFLVALRIAGFLGQRFFQVYPFPLNLYVEITFHDLGFKMGFDEKDEDAAELCIDEQNKNFV